MNSESVRTLYSKSASASPLKRIRQLSPRWLMGLGLFGLLLITLPVLRSRTVASTETESAQSKGILPVETVTVESVDGYDVTRAYTGEITSLQASELGFERSGQLVELLVPEGSQVQAGAPLARLDVRNLQTQRLQAEAERSQAIARLTELETGARTEDIASARFAVQDLEQQIGLQRTQLARREILYERGAISKETLDEYSFGEGALQARLEQARSELQELQNGTRPEQINAQQAVVKQFDARLADLDVTLAKSTLNAPFGGTVSEHKIDTGTVINAGQSVVRLVESGSAQARIGLPVTAVAKLNVGEERTVNINSEQYTATIDSILPEVDRQTRTQTVVMTLEARATTAVSPGQTVRLNLTNRIASEGMWLPSEALTQGIRGLWTSYAVMPRETEGEEDAEKSEETIFEVQPKSVEVIHQEGDRVFVTGTIQPGDQIIASGSHRLVPGQQVNPTGVVTQSFITD